MNLPSKTAILMTTALALGLGGCQGMFKSSSPAAPPPDSRAKAARQTEPAAGKKGGEGSGKAHLYVFLGRVRGQLISHANGRDSDFYINGIDVGTVGPEDYLYVDLEPGVYAFSWQARHGLMEPAKSSVDADMLQPDQDAFLALNIERNAGALLGPIGLFMDPDTGQIVDTYPRGRDTISGRHIHKPDPVIVAKLHPIAGPMTNLPPSW